METEKQVEKPDENLLYWKFDLSTFRLLGRELITDRITALFELVKNCYDANTKNVTVEFLNVNPPDPTKSKIIITDDGEGMTMTDIKTKWMVIGTNSKRATRTSKEPFKRKFVGKKGVGRFAVDKLGSKVLIKSSTGGGDLNCVEIDWSIYDSLSAESDQVVKTLEDDSIEKKPQFFTEVPNKSWIEQSANGQGTTLEITLIRDAWIENDIERAYQELAKLISPLHSSKYPFSITIKSNEYPNFKEVEVRNKAIKFSTLDFDLQFDLKKKTQETLQFQNDSLKKIDIPVKSFGPVRFRLYYFDQKAKEKFKKGYLGGAIDGIKIYRDGLITTPFAEYEHDDQKKRDILGIDKRRYSGFLDKVSSQDLLGILEITDSENSLIIDSTNRQDFVDNQQYRDLKDFIVLQLIELEKYNKHKKKKERDSTRSTLKSANDKLISMSLLLREIKKDAPKKIQKRLVELQRQTRLVQVEFKQGIRDFNALEKDLVRQEDTFMSLMSLQEYAYEIAHVVRTAVSRIIRLAEFFNDEYPNTAHEALFKSYAKDIYTEMTRLEQAVDFMLSYSRSSSNFSEINVKDLLQNLFNNYQPIFKRDNIKATFEMDETLIIVHNYKFIEDIFENLITNSVKALKKVNHRILRCTATVESDHLEVIFSDSGVGIPDREKDKVFNIFFTTTPDQGGAGIGLYIVKTRLEAMKGSIELIENELKPMGASFRIKIPFSKQDTDQ